VRPLTTREKYVDRRARDAEQQRCIRIVRGFFDWKEPDERELGNAIVKAIMARRVTPRAKEKTK
jgi:putative SOS response-associated peptidase YedK